MSSFYKGSPTLPVKDGYDIFMGTLHKGKTSRSTEVQRQELYLEKDATYESEQNSITEISNALLEKQMLVTKRKKNETNKELKRRLGFNSSLTINRWKYIEDGCWVHKWGTL